MANVNFQRPPHKQEEVGAFAGRTAVSGFPAALGLEYGNRGLSDDERSDHGVCRKAHQIKPLLQPQQIALFQQKQGGANDFPSPDSISSEGSVINPLSRQRQAVSQEPITQILSSNPRAMAIVNPIDSKPAHQSNWEAQRQPQVQESVYVSPKQCDQNHHQLHQAQQVIHGGSQYFPANALPIASYYPMYSPQQPQLHPHQTELDQQYPVYFMTARPSQAYNLPHQQTNYSEMAPNPASCHPQASRNASATKLVQVPSAYHQPLYVGYTQIHHPSHSRVATPAANANYTYEFADPARAQIYYTEPLMPQLAAQYQTMASGPAAMLPESSAQLET